MCRPFEGRIDAPGAWCRSVLIGPIGPVGRRIGSREEPQASGDEPSEGRVPECEAEAALGGAVAAKRFSARSARPITQHTLKSDSSFFKGASPPPVLTVDGGLIYLDVRT